MTINFTVVTGYSDLILVGSNYIYFDNYSRSGGTETFDLNITDSNTNYFGSDVPYFVLSNSSTKIIASGLDSNLVSDVVINLSDCSDILRISSSTGQTYTIPSCSSSYTLNDLIIVSNGNTTLSIVYSSCSSFEVSGYRIILISVSLLLLGGVLAIAYKNGYLDGLSLGQWMLLFVVIIIGLVFVNAIADQIALTCNIN